MAPLATINYQAPHEYPILFMMECRQVPPCPDNHSCCELVTATSVSPTEGCISSVSQPSRSSGSYSLSALSSARLLESGVGVGGMDTDILSRTGCLTVTSSQHLDQL